MTRWLVELHGDRGYVTVETVEAPTRDAAWDAAYHRASWWPVPVCVGHIVREGTHRSVTCSQAIISRRCRGLPDWPTARETAP